MKQNFEDKIIRLITEIFEGETDCGPCECSICYYHKMEIEGLKEYFIQSFNNWINQVKEEDINENN